MSLTDRDRLKVSQQSSRHFVTQLNLELSYGFVNFNNTQASFLETGTDGLVLVKSITDNKWAGTHTATFALTMADKGTQNTLSKPLSYTLNVEIEGNKSFNSSS